MIYKGCYTIPAWTNEPINITTFKAKVDLLYSAGYNVSVLFDELNPAKVQSIRNGDYDMNLEYIQYAHSKNLKVKAIFNWNRYVPIDPITKKPLGYKIKEEPYYSTWMNDFNTIVDHYKKFDSNGNYIGLDMLELEEPTVHNSAPFLNQMYRDFKAKLQSIGIWKKMSFGMNDPILIDSLDTEYCIGVRKHICWGIDYETICNEELMNHVLWQSSSMSLDGFQGEHNRFKSWITNPNIQLEGAVYAYYIDPIRYPTDLIDMVKYALSNNLNIYTFTEDRLRSTALSYYPKYCVNGCPGQTAWTAIRDVLLADNCPKPQFTFNINQV